MRFSLAKRLLAACVIAVLATLAITDNALAHDGPVDGEGAYVLADWMLFLFLMFAGSAAIVFVIALKRGMFKNLEDSKYYFLEYPEPDYFSPDWARHDDEQAPPEHPNGNGHANGNGTGETAGREE